MFCLVFFIIYIASLSLVCSTDPNFLLILTDDQDLLLNGMMPMKSTIELLANRGAFFQNAYVHSPICCPSRSSLLTGRYLHNIGVKNNSVSGNCYGSEWKNKYESENIAALLKKHRNYVNFYGGKYLNQYGEKSTKTEKPNGFDWWFGLRGNSKYYDYTIYENTTAVKYTDVYLTDLLGEFAKDFFRFRDKTRPFFMILAPPAPHAPFTPAPRHENLFPDAKVLKTLSFNATPFDKHWVVQMPPNHLPEDVSVLDEIQKHRLQSLKAVDELVARIMRELQMNNESNNTFVIFTSDNGFHIGQFTQPWDKRQPYQTDLLVPLIVKGPNIQEKALFKEAVSLADLGPTILDILNINHKDFDGISLKNLFDGNFHMDYSNIFIEYYGEGNEHTVDANCGFDSLSKTQLSECSMDNWCKCQDSRNNTYACVIRNDYIFDEQVKYCEFYEENGLNVYFKEVYDFKNDPHEMKNIEKQMDKKILGKLHRLLESFLKCKGIECQKLRTSKAGMKRMVRS